MNLVFFTGVCGGEGQTFGKSYLFVTQSQDTDSLPLCQCGRSVRDLSLFVLLSETRVVNQGVLSVDFFSKFMETHKRPHTRQYTHVSVRVPFRLYVHTCHTCVSTCGHPHPHTSLSTCVLTSVPMCPHTHVHTRVHTCVFTSVHKYRVHTYVRVFTG